VVQNFLAQPVVLILRAKGLRLSRQCL